MKKLFKKIGFIGFVIATSATSAMAEINTDDIAYNTDDAFNIAALVLGAIAVVWGIRQAISIGRR